jgi:stage V sporulation protein S
VRDHEAVGAPAIGAEAVNQAVKAVALANTYLEQDPTPLSITFVPKMVPLEIDGKEKVAIRLTILPAAASRPSLTLLGRRAKRPCGSCSEWGRARAGWRTRMRSERVILLRWRAPL